MSNFALLSIVIGMQTTAFPASKDSFLDFEYNSDAGTFLPVVKPTGQGAIILLLLISLFKIGQCSTAIAPCSIHLKN